MLSAGDLDQRILVETPVVSANVLGEDVTTWQNSGLRWARVEQSPGREFLSGDYVAEDKAVFVTRWFTVNSTARVIWAGRTWRIASTTGTRREGWKQLFCVAQEDQEGAE